MNLDKQLLSWAKQSRFALVLTVGLGCIAGILTVALSHSLSQIINLVYLEGRSLQEVSRMLVILLGILFFRASILWGSELSANNAALKIKFALRQHLLRHILRMGPANTNQEKVGELTNTAVQGVESLEAYFSQYLPSLVLAAMVPITYLIFVFPVDLLTGLILLLTAPLIPVFMILIGNLSKVITQRQWESLGRLSAYFLDVLQGLTTLKMLGLSRQHAQKISEVSNEFSRITMSVLRVTFLSTLVLEMVATLSTAVVAVEVGLRLLYGQLSFQKALFVLLLAPEFYLPLRLLGTRFHAGMSGIVAARRIFEILEIPETFPNLLVNIDEMEEKPDPEKQSTETNQAPSIRFDQVRYSYPSPSDSRDKRPALNGVSFFLPKGQKTALVGSSGGGKSTIAALLLRFIDPNQGLITVDGRPLNEISPKEWLSQIAWVPQKPYLFNDSVLANIRLANPDANLEQVIQAARQAEADNFIQALPDGYNTLIGERGSRLSGGEAQRIALARAFLKGSPFVILDEATANLDPENEAHIHQAITRLLKDRTVCIIAHRLNTVQEADQVIVIDKGKIVESGPPGILQKENGLYNRLIQAFYRGFPQAQQFSEPIVSRKEQRDSLEPLLTIIPQPQIFPVESLRLKEQADPFWRLLRFLAPFKGKVALSVLMSTATILSGVGLMSASAYIISAAAMHPSIAELQIAIVGVRFFGISRGVFRYLERYISHLTTFQLLASMRTWFYQALEPLAPASLLRYRSGDLLTRILGDIELLESFFVRSVSPPLTSVLVTGIIYVFLAQFETRLAMAWLFFMVLAGVIVPLVNRSLGSGYGKKLVFQRSSMNAGIVDCIQGLPDLFAFGQEERLLKQIIDENQSLITIQKRMSSLASLQNILSGLMANLGMWVVLILAIPLVLSGQMDGVYLTVVILAALTGFEAVSPLPLAALYLENNLQAARRLFEVVDSYATIQDPSNPLPLSGEFELEVKNLSFQYPSPSNSQVQENMDWVLKDISFLLPRGKRLAIVGSSGAGKSSLINLLLRFWDYQKGEILLTNQDLHLFGQDDIRSCIALIPQNIYLFSTSIRENIRMGNPRASDSEIMLAAKQARIHNFIETLPEGYDTWIGEQGLLLSGGERQRLAIARALLRLADLEQSASLLILDEATANLDPITESEVLSSIYAQSNGTSTLVATHRLAGMEMMDEILVLDKGEIVERGCHNDLMNANGFYRRLWDIQNSIF